MIKNNYFEADLFFLPSDRSDQSGHREARRQPGLRGTAMNLHRPPLMKKGRKETFAFSSDANDRLRLRPAPTLPLSIFVCKDCHGNEGKTKNIKNHESPEEFYLPVKECKHFVLFFQL